MRERITGSRGKGLLARRAGAAALLSSWLPPRFAARRPFKPRISIRQSGPATGGTVVPIVGNQFRPGATVTVGGVPVSVQYENSTRIGATMPALAAGKLFDVVVTNPGAGGSSAIPFGLVRGLQRRSEGQSVPRLRREDGARRNHLRLHQRQLLPQTRSPAPRWRSSCCAPSTAAVTCRPRPPAPSSSTCASLDPNPTFAAEWIEQLASRGHHGRLPGGLTRDGQPAAVLPRLPRSARADGGLSPEDPRGRRPPTAAGDRHVPGRSADGSFAGAVWRPGSRSWRGCR